MRMKSIALGASALALSTSVNAVIISTDWQTAGDNLITRDSVSGLDWLDLTETNNMSYDYVNGQLDISGMFEGFRYASNAEVLDIWSIFNINLGAGQPTGISNYTDPGVAEATSFFGDISMEGRGSQHGVFGLTSHVPAVGEHTYLGGFTENQFTGYRVENYAAYDDTLPRPEIGSYLVRASVVPIPAAAWLFSSGLIGLIGIARRKAKA